MAVIDPVFSDEYLDAPPAEGETTRFLIDYSAPTRLEGGRRVVVSTRSRAELRNLFQPLISRQGVDVPKDRVDSLLDGLQLLGSGLGLKLLNNKTQALEAFSLALGSLYLAEQGVLRRAIAIPLDLHQDLVLEERHWKADNTNLDRSDLAIVQIDPTRRHFGVHLVELKARSGGAGGDLVAKVVSQLENSRKVLRGRLFGADLREHPGSLAAALQVRRLSKLLSRSLGEGLPLRAHRCHDARRYPPLRDRPRRLVHNRIRQARTDLRDERRIPASPSASTTYGLFELAARRFANFSFAPGHHSRRSSSTRARRSRASSARARSLRMKIPGGSQANPI